MTGFGLVPRGPVAVTLFPRPAIVFSGVALQGPDGGEPELAADEVAVSLRLLPLVMRRRAEIAGISLVRPRISVVVGQDGRTNWSQLIDALPRGLKPDGPGGQALSLSEIAIRNGVVALRIPDRGVDETLDGVELALAWPAFTESFAATGRFDWHHETVEASLAVANFPGTLAGEDSGLKFRARSGPARVAFDGVLSYRPTLKLDGTLAGDAASLRRALLWGGGRSLPANGLGPFALRAHAVATSRAIALSDLNVELDGNVAEGALSYAVTGRQSFQGTLAVESLDLTPYVSTLRLIADNARGWDRRSLMLAWFNGWEADVRLSAARVRLANAELGRTAVAASMRSGRFVVTVGESQAYDGVVTGSIAVGRSQEGADFSSRMQFSGVNLQGCLGQAFGINQLEGTGNLEFDVASHGHNVQELAGNLNGTLQIAATDGGLNGVNVEQMMRRLQRSPLQAAAADVGAGRTPFDKLNIGLRVVQGLATIDDVALSGPSVRLAVTGTTSIPDRELNLAGTAHLISARSDAAPLFELPFTVRGQWASPSIVPDTRTLIENSPAVRALIDTKERTRARDETQDAVNRLINSFAPLRSR